MNKSINIYLMASLAAMCSVSLVSCDDDDPEDNTIKFNGTIGSPVDLGLPSGTLWADHNIGASKPEDYGWHIAWGETTTKKEYSNSSYTLLGQFVGDNKTTLDKEDDAASVNWGGDWVMPSRADFEELHSNCDFEWTTLNGVNGLKVLASNGNSIFFPAVGCRTSKLDYNGEKGFYWSSSLYQDYSQVGYLFSFSELEINSADAKERYYSIPVRPVCMSGGNTNGHVSVDLGLPSGKLWASCNIGASSPEESGDYVSWGETEPKEENKWKNYKFSEGHGWGEYINKYQAEDNTIDCVWYNSKYSIVSGNCILEIADDAANVNWGDGWRMPSWDDFQELYMYTSQTWTDNYNGTGVSGCIVTSRVSGYEAVSIFLPAAGYYKDDYFYDDGLYGRYWMSDIHSNCIPGRASALDFGYYRFEFNNWYFCGRECGLSIRPVYSSAK